MADFIKFGQGIADFLTRKVGGFAGVKYQMTQKELEELALENHAVYDFLSEHGIIGQNGLAIDILTEAKKNYSIASLNIRNASSSIISGFYSEAKGNAGKVEKYHFSDKQTVYTGYKDLKSSIDKTAKNTTIPYTAEDLIEDKKKGMDIVEMSRKYKKARSTLNLLLPDEYKKSIRLTPEEINTIRAMADSGMSASEIAQKRGLEVSTVRSHLPKENKTGNVISEEIHDKINELFEQGLSIDEISKACDVGLQTVRRHIKNKDAIPGRSDVKVTEDMVKRIIEMYSQGMTKTQIGKELGIGRMTVDRHIPEEMKKSKGFSQEKIDQINELGAKGLSARQIAKELGISSGAVNKYILPEYKKEIKTPAEIIEKIKLLYSQGMSTKDIAKECGVGENIVYKYRTTKETDTNSELYKRVNFLRKNGKSIDDIAKECSVSRATVYNYLAPELKQGDEITEEVKAEIDKMRKAGISADEIAKKFSISRASVYNHLDEELKYNWVISEELHEKINTLRKAGLTTRQIAKECNISNTSVLNHLSEDLKPKQRANLISKEEIIAHLSKGKSIYDIAKEHEIGAGTVWKTMRRFGIHSEASVRGKLRETSAKKYEQYNNDELKERFLNVISSLFDNKKINEETELGKTIDKITDEILSNNINLETREKLIKLIRKLDLTERNIVSPSELKNSEELSQLKIWANKSAKIETIKGNLNYLIHTLLPQNEEFELAQILSKYEIKGIDDPNVKLLNDYIQRLANPENLSKECAKILRTETYKNASPEIKLLADKYSISILGKIDEETAGRYIRNLTALDDTNIKMPYPKNFVNIIKESGIPKQLGARYLTELDKWFESGELERSKLKDFCKIFNMNENLGSKIIKEYILNTYAKLDTKIIAKGDNKTEMEAVFVTTAKDGIIEQFGFPDCTKWFMDFEDAMTVFISPDANRSGIKYMKNRGEYEVKISNESNRLLSSDKSLRFDIYKREGLHTKKKK